MNKALNEKQRWYTVGWRRWVFIVLSVVRCFMFERDRARAGTVPVRVNTEKSDKFHIKQLFIFETAGFVSWVERGGNEVTGVCNCSAV
ncbi:hypothetical protein IIE18_08425 [Pseudomonas sp. V1]|uniref:hypothetical protein n=1 Tax=Pseudomonas arcuscaelestis TaxID=2710591 RepID=UPI00193FF5E5|nr:hypothetical protein [Pseudomonas arcuscaelestis]MBM3105159.1 hypothetical protein [Pseudomonas arcuscaelestis]